MDTPVRTEIDTTTGVATVVLVRSGQRNPLSVSMMRGITAALRTFADDESVRVVVIAADGPAFSAGHDLSEMIDRDIEDERVIFEVCTEMMDTVQEIPQPVIAAVQGPAIAAGCQLAASCDLVVASSNAVFGTPGVRIGLFCSTPMVALSRSVGRKRAMQMLLTGETVDAATAAEWGLVNVVAPPDQLDARVHELATRIAEASPLTLAIGKQAFYRQIDLPQDEAYELMTETMAANAVTFDAQEGMSAFLEKRKPLWRGK